MYQHIWNTKPQLHLLKYLITGAKILFYKSQIMKLIDSHFCHSVYSKYMAKHIYKPVSSIVKLMDEICTSANQYVNLFSESWKPVEYFSYK